MAQIFFLSFSFSFFVRKCFELGEKLLVEVIEHMKVCLKALIPQGSTRRSSTFLVSDEIPYFSHYNHKISASISNLVYFGSYIDQKMYLFLVYDWIFCIFITGSWILHIQYLFLFQGRNLTINLEVKSCKMCL